MDLEIKGHSFYIEVIAPKGLIGLDKALAESELGLFIYHSQFNGKNILKSRNDNIEFSMDTSLSDVMQASGFLYFSFDQSVATMQKLSDIFKLQGYPHRIILDDEDSGASTCLDFDYPA